MKKNVFLLTSLIFFLCSISIAQVSITTDGSVADANTMLDVKSTARGVKFPRMTSAQRKVISVNSTDAGLMVFDTDRQALYMFDGTNWMPFAYASTAPIGDLKPKVAAGTTQFSSFGYSCDIEGNYAVVGAKEDSAGNVPGGAAYVYQRVNGNWVVMTKLVASDPVSGDYFGDRVSISGDYIVVSCHGKKVGANYTQGAAYVFVRNGNIWTQQAKLVANDGGAQNYFSSAVSIEGSTILIGASWAKVGANAGQGAAYVFSRVGNVWTQQYKLVATDGKADEHFGGAVAISGDYFVIGAWQGIGTGGFTSGTAYVFVKGGNTYTQQAKLNSNYPKGNGNFGGDVDIDGSTIVVGASGEFSQGDKTGTAHVFLRTNSTWTHKSTLSPYTKKTDIRFGGKVKIKGDMIMVGASKEDVNVYEQGSVYAYKWNGSYYTNVKVISDKDGLVAQHFGFAIGFDGVNYIIGAPYGLRSDFKSKGMVFFGSVQY